MGRAPCCAKVGLKKGPWSHDEDQILISYIQQNGHPNWRALPKHAGLLRCGKSCRLRWTNYLRPDIKRGNFSKEEEDTIVHLHDMLGNRWSVIAAKLPGRTDNEIKNVWHTYLKKRLEGDETTTLVTKKRQVKPKCATKDICLEEQALPECNIQLDGQSISNQSSSSDSSSITDAKTDSPGVAKHEEIDHDMFLDDSFWSETLSGEGDNNMESNQLTNVSSLELPTSPHTLVEMTDTKTLNGGSDTDGMHLWYDIFTCIEELPELSEFEDKYHCTFI